MRISLPGISGSLGECILCGESFCAEILLNQSVPIICIDGFGDKDLPIHKKCLTVLEANGKDWHTLPDGPLRQEFERAHVEHEDFTQQKIDAAEKFMREMAEGGAA